MRRSFRILAVLACALPLACADVNNTPTATAPPPVPSLTANPASNGSLVVRGDYEGWFLAAWRDASNQLIAFNTSFDLPGGCTGPVPFTHDLWQAVQSGKYPLDVARYHRLDKLADAFINIYSGDWNTIDLCQPLATGTGKLMLTDNDALGAGTGGRTEANAFGLMAVGEVTDGNGQLYKYSGHTRGVVHPDGTVHEESFVNLKPHDR